MPSDAVANYQPYWALKAHLSRALGRANQARDAYAQAISLTEDAAAREFLVAQAAAVR
jgi:RNA polymerase sigma-70 factor (ECF subfamily)